LVETGLLWGEAGQLYNGMIGVIDFPERRAEEVNDRKTLELFPMRRAISLRRDC
jgi:hypothetical protein